MARRRRNPISTEQVLLVAGGAVGGIIAFNWYQNHMAAVANAAAVAANTAPTQALPPATSSSTGTPQTTPTSFTPSGTPQYTGQ